MLLDPLAVRLGGRLAAWPWGSGLNPDIGFAQDLFFNLLSDLKLAAGTVLFICNGLGRAS